MVSSWFPSATTPKKLPPKRLTPLLLCFHRTLNFYHLFCLFEVYSRGVPISQLSGVQTSFGIWLAPSDTSTFGLVLSRTPRPIATKWLREVASPVLNPRGLRESLRGASRCAMSHTSGFADLLAVPLEAKIHHLEKKRCSFLVSVTMGQNQPLEDRRFSPCLTVHQEKTKADGPLSKVR